MTFKDIGFRGLAIVLSALLCNVPQYASAQASATTQTQDQNGTQAPDQQAAPAQQTPADPSQAPLAPVPTARPAETNTVPPDAPSEVQRTQQTEATTAPADTQPVKQQPSNPLGTATAQQGATRGGAASKPAGEAIAPAKQRQVHSMLIKVGLLAAGAVAVGTVVALTRGTSSIPPGAR